jgi:hypothetical protein
MPILESPLFSEKENVFSGILVLPESFEGEEILLEVWQNISESTRYLIGKTYLVAQNNKTRLPFSIPMKFYRPKVGKDYLLPPKVKEIEELIWFDLASYTLQARWKNETQIWDILVKP